MNRFIVSSMAAAIVCGGSALAADMPVKAPRVAAVATSPWDWAFGGALMSDYNFRGISQSNRGPSATVYSEGRYNATSNIQFYLATQYWAVTLPTNPTAEVDIFGGVRLSMDPLTFDFGAMYYWYPRERQHNSGIPGAPFPTYPNGNATLSQTDFWEVYGKLGWDVVKDRFAVGANAYYTPSWLNTGASGLFATATAKLTLPSFRANLGMINEIGWYVSGEFGYYWLGTTRAYPVVYPTPINLPDYATWNAGVAFTWKVATLDLRYYDTNLSKANCNVLTGDPNATFAPGNVTPLNPGGMGSKWCNAAFVAALKFDLVASQHLK
ncbi:MAG: hypothetical protein IT536_12225 [Hyphomicrobiales bacterium]|nr:hypothetical protein [Hyphomicrobiales bacterium]